MEQAGTGVGLEAKVEVEVEVGVVEQIEWDERFVFGDDIAWLEGFEQIGWTG